MTYEGLAAAIHAQTGESISARAIRDMEAGRREPQVAKLKAVASYLGFKPSELMADIRKTRERKDVA